MPALPPGPYTVTFTLSGMTTVTRQAEVQLAQDTVVEATLSVGGVSETVEVTATASLIERDASSVKSSVVLGTDSSSCPSGSSIATCSS